MNPPGGYLNGTGEFGLVALDASRHHAQPLPGNVMVVQGTPTAPVTQAAYATPAFYGERWDASNVAPGWESTWNNPFMTPMFLAEIQVCQPGNTAPAGFCSRVSSTVELPPSGVGAVHGSAFLAQSYPPAGKQGYDAWALGVVVEAAASGGYTRNAVCIEADVVNAQRDADHDFSTTNYTAFWAQAAAAGRIASTALYVTSQVPGSGWRHGLYVAANVTDWLAWLDTGNPTGNGLYVNVPYTSGGPENNVLIRARVGGATGVDRFQVTADPFNACWLMVGGALRQVLVGAPDSAGPGYRTLRVAN